LKQPSAVQSQVSQLGLWWGQLTRTHGIRKPTGLVRAITKGLVRGVPATAETDGRPAGQAKGFTFGIEDLEVAFNADRSVVIHRNFRGRHFFSRGTESMPILARRDKHKCPHPPSFGEECGSA
jgi:hypothetical protein